MSLNLYQKSDMGLMVIPRKRLFENDAAFPSISALSNHPETNSALAGLLDQTSVAIIRRRIVVGLPETPQGSSIIRHRLTLPPPKKRGRPPVPVEPRKIDRIKRLWETTDMSYKLISDACVVSAERVKKTVEAHPEWKRRSLKRTAPEGQKELLDIFVQVSRENKLCPTNEELSLQMDAPLSSVTMWIGQLRTASKIVTRPVLLTHNNRNYYRRVVTILGQRPRLRSAEPTITLVLNNRPGLAVDTAELEEAKAYLRRKGDKPVVYDAAVVDPRKAGLGLVMVDSRELTADAVLALARERGFVCLANLIDLPRIY